MATNYGNMFGTSLAEINERSRQQNAKALQQLTTAAQRGPTPMLSGGIAALGGMLGQASVNYLAGDGLSPEQQRAQQGERATASMFQNGLNTPENLRQAATLALQNGSTDMYFNLMDRASEMANVGKVSVGDQETLLDIETKKGAIARTKAQEVENEKIKLMSTSQKLAYYSKTGQMDKHKALQDSQDATRARVVAENGQNKLTNARVILEDPNSSDKEKRAISQTLVGSQNDEAKALGAFWIQSLNEKRAEGVRLAERKTDTALTATNRKEDKEVKLYGMKVNAKGEYVFDGTTTTGVKTKTHPNQADGNFYSTSSPVNPSSPADNERLFTAHINTMGENLESIQGSIRTLTNFEKADGLLKNDKIDLMVGTAGNLKLQISKVFKEAGLGNPEDAKDIAETEAFLALMGQGSAELIASGAFGAGTGISDKDLAEAKKLLAADQSLDRNGMRLILKVRAQMEVNKIKQYEDVLDYNKDEVWDASPRVKDGYYVSKDIPNYWKPQSADDSSVGGGWISVEYPSNQRTGAEQSKVDAYLETLEEN